MLVRSIVGAAGLGSGIFAALGGGMMLAFSKEQRLNKTQ